MSDEVTYPYVPADLLMDNWEQRIGGDYSKLWGRVVGLYSRRGVWQFTAVLKEGSDPKAGAVSVACYGAAIGADQCVWYASAMDTDYPAWLADRFVVAVYADRWGTKKYRRRKILIGDRGSVIPAGPWTDGPTDGGLLCVLGIPWEMGEAGDPNAILQLLVERGHVINRL